MSFCLVLHVLYMFHSSPTISWHMLNKLWIKKLVITRKKWYLTKPILMWLYIIELDYIQNFLTSHNVTELDKIWKWNFVAWKKKLLRI